MAYSNTNRKWQNHLRSKGIIPFFLDRLKSHALSSSWQFDKGPFYFKIENRERDDELSKAFFQFVEAFPYEFFIEFTNNCNLNCKMCARTVMKRSRGYMSKELFKKIIDEIAENMPYAFVHYYGIGESMLDPNIYEKLKYARNKGIINTVLFTNGQLLLHDSNYQKLADCDLAIIGVDLDGFSQRTYGKIRLGGDFGLAKKGILMLRGYIRSKKLRTRVEIAYQVYPGINEHELEEFAKWCTQNDLEYKVVTMHTWAGLRNDIPKSGIFGITASHQTQRVNPCPYLYSGFAIMWDGRVGLCFYDADTREVLGDLNKQSIKEIWSTMHKNKRREHIKGIFTGICKECTSGTQIAPPKFNSRLYPE